MDTVQTAATILWILLLPTLIFLIPFYYNRHIQPIRGRYPVAALIEIIGVFFTSTNQWVVVTFPQANCSTADIFQFLTSCIIQFAFNYRLVQLLFAYEITRNISELKENKNLKDWKPNWFTSHRELAQPKFTLKTIVVISAIYIIIIILSVAAAPQHDICQFKYYGNIFTAKGVIGVIFSLVLASKLWRYPNDAFGIKTEFKLTVGSIIIVSVCAVFINAADKKIKFCCFLSFNLCFLARTIFHYYTSILEIKNQ